jgi:hypothetical protein
MTRRPVSGRPATILAVPLALVAAGVFLFRTVTPAWDHLRYGFPAYYTASRLVIAGEWSSLVYDNAWFGARVLQLTDGAIYEQYRGNPPPTSLLALPVAGFDIVTARRLWLTADVLLVVVALACLLAALPALRSPPRAALFIALCLVWSPLRQTVSLGQAYALLLALQAVALLALVRGRYAVAGLAIGVAMATKLAAVPLLVLLAVRGSGRAVFAAIAAGTVIAMASLPYAGLAGWAGFVQALREGLPLPAASLAVTAYQSAAGLLSHLLAPDPTWNPGAVAALPTLAWLVSVVVVVAALLVTFWLARRGRLDVSVAAAIAVGVLVLDVAQEYHFAVLLVPAAVALARWLDAPDRHAFDGLWLGTALLLLAAPLPYTDPALGAGWAALLAYPRVYGAWLLWGWLVRSLWKERQSGGGCVAGR